MSPKRKRRDFLMCSEKLHQIASFACHKIEPIRGDHVPPVSIGSAEKMDRTNRALEAADKRFEKIFHSGIHSKEAGKCSF